MAATKERKLSSPNSASGKGGGSGGAGDGDEDGKKKKGGPLKLVIIIVAGVLLVAGGSVFGFWWFAIRVPPPEPPPEPGEVVALEAISLNLADGHYLKLGISLQMTADAASGGHGSGSTDGSAALDLAIEVFSGRSMEELEDAEEREHLKEELLLEVEEAYHHTVMDIYFTEFVMQ